MDLSVAEAARILGVNERVVHDHITSGRLRASLKGRDLYVAREDLDRFLGAGASSPAQPSEEPDAPFAAPAISALRSALERLASLEQRMAESWSLVERQQELVLALEQSQRELAELRKAKPDRESGEGDRLAGVLLGALDERLAAMQVEIIRAVTEEITEVVSKTVAEQLQKVEERVATSLEQVRSIRVELSRELLRELQRKEQELANKELEIERMESNLSYQKRLAEKELEEQKEFLRDQQRSLDERRAHLQRESELRLEQQREHYEQRLELEEKHWVEKLEQRREHHEQQLRDAKQREGFWSRLVRMMTWS